MKARANVKTARIELDSARAAWVASSCRYRRSDESRRLKAATPAKQEQARYVTLSSGRQEADCCRLHVEEAEDKLVQNTETAIGLMKSVLENVCSLSSGWRVYVNGIRM